MKIVKRISVGLVSFFLWFFTAFMLLFSLTKTLSDAKLISENTTLIFPCVASAILSVVFTCLTHATNILNSLWLAENGTRLFILYLIFLFGVISLKFEIVFTHEYLREFIGIQWTIFTISIAVFLVWNTFVIPSLEAKRPNAPSDSNDIMKALDIEDKQNHTVRVKSTFMSVTILALNLVALLAATSITYVNGPESFLLLAQNLATFSFYFCTNTLIILLSDVVQPLLADRRKYLNEVKVTKEDARFLALVSKQVKQTNKLIRKIDKLDGISVEQKSKIIDALLENLYDNECGEDKK